MSAPRIFLIHATPVAIAPITEAFTRLWPQARLANLLEDSLSSDLAQAGGLTPGLNERFVKLATYAAQSGADAILFTCSAFGEAIDLCKRSVSIPVLKPNEAMIDQALARARKITILATFEPSIASMTEEFEARAQQLGVTIELRSQVCPEALDELCKGNASRHDSLIVDSARGITHSKLLCFSQFSMTRAAQPVSEASGLPVLTTPDSAVLKLRELLNA